MEPYEAPRRRFLDVVGAAKLIARTEGAIRLMVQRKQIPHYKLGKRLLFDQDELIRWVEDGRQEVTSSVR